MASEIISKTQVVRVTDVEDVVISSIAADGGQQVRAIRIYGTPNGVNGAPVFELQIAATTADKIRISTPETTF